MYVPFLLIAVPHIGARVSENAFGLMCTGAMVLPAAGFLPYFRGWLSGTATALLVTLPYVILMLALAIVLES